jgi:hypothetical protein
MPSLNFHVAHPPKGQRYLENGKKNIIKTTIQRWEAHKIIDLVFKTPHLKVGSPYV